MKRFIRSLLRLSFFLLLLLIGVVIVNTATFTSRQVNIKSVEPVSLDSTLLAGRLARALQYPTVSLPRSVDTAAFIGLDTFLHNTFPLVDSLLELQYVNRFSRIYKWPGRNARLNPILLTGHQDVVTIDESSLSLWQEQPFLGKVAEGFIWGRGALDDKLSVMGLLEAAEQLLEDGYQPARTLYFAFGHDEEVGGQNGAQQMASYFAREGIHFEYTLDEGMLIMEDALEGVDKPVAIIGVAEKGYATLTLTAQLDEAGHSSMPPRHTAAGLLSEAIVKLEANPFPAAIDGALADFFSYVGPELSFPYKSLFANRWLTEGLLISQMSMEPATNASIRTTLAPTMLRAGFKENVLPTRASAKVNFRIKPGETKASVLEYVREIINDERIIITISPDTDATDPTPVSETASFGFEVIQRTVQEIFPDVLVAPGLVVGTTDGKYYEKVSDNVYRFAPVKVKKEDLKRIHGINERISVQAYQQLVQFYYQLLKNSCQ